MNLESNPDWRRKYEKHLKSAQWRNMRRDLFRLRGEKCEVCKKPSPNLEIHHLNYKRLGSELASDLKIVCKKCHIEQDRMREIEVMREREARRYNSAFDTWFEKKYGVESFYAVEADLDEFRRWIERKNENY
jgi:5-methylcytosine-specific restriction endonuclease McrA